MKPTMTLPTNPEGAKLVDLIAEITRLAVALSPPPPVGGASVEGVAAIDAPTPHQGKLLGETGPELLAATEAYLSSDADRPASVEDVIAALARYLLKRDHEVLSDDLCERVMATTTHIGTPPCKMAATCDACVRDEYLSEARAILALIRSER